MGSHHFTEEMEWESLEEDGSRGSMVQVKQIEEKFRRFPIFCLSSTQLPCPDYYINQKWGIPAFF